MDVRVATPDDAGELLGIYAPYVRDTAITFECVVPTLEEFASRVSGTLERYPYLVAIGDSGEICGFAYAGAVSGRGAYAWTAETTIYVRGGQRRRGVGQMLYNSLENVLHSQNVVELVAVVARPGTEDDDRVDSTSYLFHRRMGYELVGEFERCGYKFDRWYNVALMHKQIASHGTPPAPFAPFGEIRTKVSNLDIA